MQTNLVQGHISGIDGAVGQSKYCRRKKKSMGLLDSLLPKGYTREVVPQAVTHEYFIMETI